MSDWSENAYTPVDQTGYEAPEQFTPTEPDATTYDDINMYAGIMNSLTGGGSDSYEANELDTEQRGVNTMGELPSGTGGPPADKTPSGLDSMLASFKKFIGWNDKTDPRVKAAALTVGAGAVAGMGKAYMDNKKLALEEKKISTDTMLAETQANLAKQRMANQAGPLTFNAPKGIIGGQIAKITPFQNRIPR